MSSTVKQIAQLANVSAATVSLVLNGREGISEQTRSRVLAAAAQLNYVQRPLKSQKSSALKTLRFLKVATHGHTVNRDHNTFIADYIDGMTSEAGLLGYKLEIVSFEGVPMDDIIASISEPGLDGVIVLGTELAKQDIARLQALPVHLVVMDTFCEFLECNFVNMNNLDAVYKIIAYFVECGFKRIGFIASNVETINFQLRKAGFLEVMKKFDLDFDPKDIVTVDSTYQGAYEDMLGSLKNGLAVPDCYFCTNDIITYGCIKAFREFAIRIPEDLSIIGFDNLPMSATMDPPLTTIDVSKQKIAAVAVRLLDELIKSTEPQAAVKILVGASLVVRNSVIGKARTAV